jgi:putative ABC transport system ATP-binding protein
MGLAQRLAGGPGAVAVARAADSGKPEVQSKSVIAVRDLVKRARRRPRYSRLRGANMDVQPGEFVAITGPSGSGKSTLMHILGCLDRPTSGQYVLDGQDVSRMSKDQLALIRNRKIGFVFQGFNLLSRTALDSVGCRCSTAPPGTVRGPSKLATQALVAVGLSGGLTTTNQHPAGSGASRSRALVTQPTILLASRRAISIRGRASVMDIFQRLNVERGITLLITHEHAIAEYGTRLVRFRDGRIQVDEPIAHRRNAQEELAALPPPEPEDDAATTPSDTVAVDHGGAV